MRQPDITQGAQAPRLGAEGGARGRAGQTIDYFRAKLEGAESVKILVTGGAGFIGSHVVDAYVAAGHEVRRRRRPLDRAAREPEPEGDASSSVDIADAQTRRADRARAARRAEPSRRADGRAPLGRRPAFDARVNVLGLINLLEAGEHAGVKKVIFASSGGAVYGEQETLSRAGEHPTRPVSPYGVSKRAGELYLSYYHQAVRHAVRRAALRQRLRPAPDPHGEAGVVAIFMSTAAARRDADDQRRRQADARLRLRRRRGARQPRGARAPTYVGAVNIGTGVETDVVTLCAASARGVGQRDRGAARPGQGRRAAAQRLDAARAAQVLGWKPQGGAATKGCSATVAFLSRDSR